MSRVCKPTRDKPMSYILDALKRADAERERGTVPGLHARQVTTPASQAAPSTRSRLWLAAAAALALGGIAAGLWVWQTPAGDVRLAAVEPAVARPTVTAPLAQPVPTPTSIPASASASALQPAVPALRAVAPSPPAVTPAVPTTVSKPALPAPAVGTQAPPKPKLDPVAKAAEPGATAQATPMPLPTAKASAPQTAPAAVPLLSELPENLRRQIPLLAITGAVYSENPGQRLLLVNNQVLTQGSLAAPEVNLEEIRARSSVFSFRGTRFRVMN
jgi:general secretion pathway protein B